MKTVVHTPGLEAGAKAEGMTEEEVLALANYVAATPEAGDMIVGSGGCRKVRWAKTGGGKSGGYRVVTFFPGKAEVYLVAVLAKGKRANFQRCRGEADERQGEDDQRRQVSRAEIKEGQMPKSDDTNFKRIMRGLDEVAAYVDGTADRSAYKVHVPVTVDVKGVRGRLGLSQAAFASRYGFSKAAVQDWEQGRRQPEASARVLLTVIDREPEAVQRALGAA